MRIKLAGLFILLVLLTGCSYEIPSQSEVIALVDEECPNEKYELVNIDKKSEDEVVYEFKSLERELEFSVKSYLREVTIDGAYFGDAPGITCDYVDNIHRLYRDDDKSIIYMDITGDRDEDFNKLSKKVHKWEAIYKEEEQYNTRFWMSNHPLLTIILKDNGNTVGSIDITGSLDDDNIKIELQNAYDLMYSHSF